MLKKAVVSREDWKALPPAASQGQPVCFRGETSAPRGVLEFFTVDYVSFNISDDPLCCCFVPVCLSSFLSSVPSVAIRVEPQVLFGTEGRRRARKVSSVQPSL